jgi:hypothetical protein
MRIQYFLAVAALLLSASVAARADDIYTVTITNEGSAFDGSYSFDESSILTSETTIPAADLTVLSGTALDSITIDPASPACPIFTYATDSSCVQLAYPSNNGLTAWFTEDLTSPGTYTAATAPMTVSIEPSTTSVTPEPSSIALLGTGLLGFAGVLRRRFVA